MQTELKEYTKNVLTIQDVAKYTGFSVAYLYKCTCKGLIPYYKPLGKKLFFDREEIDEWLKSNRHSSNAELEQAAVAYCLTHKRGGVQ